MDNPDRISLTGASASSEATPATEVALGQDSEAATIPRLEVADITALASKEGKALGPDPAIATSPDSGLATIPRLELADIMVTDLPGFIITDIDDSTAEIAANSPRYRRRSSTFIDGVHDLRDDKAQMAPAQLYSTMSGRLFHSGRIAIVMVGPPARGKTHISVSLARYLRWLGVKTRIFHLGDYRRATLRPGQELPDDYFFINAAPESVLLRQKILKKCRSDIYNWLNHENGQVAIYDSVNPLASGRRSLAKEFAKHDVQTIFLESYVTDETILEDNARSVKISSPDFKNWDPNDAAKEYLRRILTRIPDFQTMEEKELNYVKLINAGEQIMMNNVSFGYVSMRVVFYLMNLHNKAKRTFFVRAGTSREEDFFKADAHLSPEGREYSKIMGEILLKHREQEQAAFLAAGGSEADLKPLIVWTSTRRRTVETADYFGSRGHKITQRPQLSQLNPGVCEKMSEEELRAEFPDEVMKHEIDPYHHRYPRAESYHDVAVRMEPVILELEREKSDVLIIAHESVLRVLYGYLMACDAMDIPKLRFPRDEIVEIVPASYQNEAKRIHIPGLAPEIIPPSPEDLKMPVVISGSITPSSGIGSPAEPIKTSLYNETLKKLHVGAAKSGTPDDGAAPRAEDSLRQDVIKPFDAETLKKLEDQADSR